MASLSQIAANRKNAQLSTGPRTPEGRAAVRFNALQSGIHAFSQIIAGEDPQAFQGLADQLADSCNPADAREQVLVDRMIAHSWRLTRLLNAEPLVWERCFAHLRNNVDFSDETKTGDALDHNQQTFLRIQRLIASVEKSYHQAAVDLDRLQAARARSAQTQPAQDPPLQPLTPEIGFVPSTSPDHPASEASTPASKEIGFVPSTRPSQSDAHSETGPSFATAGLMQKTLAPSLSDQV